jgi:hypothetical protein
MSKPALFRVHFVTADSVSDTMDVQADTPQEAVKIVAKIKGSVLVTKTKLVR